MIINKSNSLKKLFKKVGIFSASNFLSKFKSIKNLKPYSNISKISKNDRYKNIIKMINQFKIYKISSAKDQKSKKFNSNTSKILKTQRYKNIIKMINQFKIYKISSKKNKKAKKSDKNLNNIDLSSYFFRFFEGIKKFDLIKTKLKLPKNKSNKKYDQKIGLAFYGDHNLIIANVIIDLNNNIEVIALNEIPIPGNIIGDSLVEDSNELANILLDSLTLLDLINSPLLFVLSSSFFNIHTFCTSDLKQISESDSKVQSKSPYLQANTLVDFLRMTDKKITKGLVRTIYSKRDFIKGWTDTLEIINVPIIGLVPASTHIFDSITSKIAEEITVLLDIESTQSTLLIGSNLSELNSYKLPFGYSLYISDNLSESSNSYFDRALNSIKLIMKETNQKLPASIYVMGKGLDVLLNTEIALPRNFKSISDLNLTNYLYKPKTMQIHEIVSNSIDNSIISLVSILSSCV